MEDKRDMETLKRLGAASWIYLALVTIAGIALRCWWILSIPAKPVSDFKVYHTLATNIFNHLGFTLRGHPVAYQGMGYPTVLGYLYRMAGAPDPMIGKWFNVILSVATMAIFLFILCRLTGRKFVILSAYTLIALLPTYIAYTNVLGSEVLLTFLFATLIWLQIAGFDWRLRIVLIGIITGLAALTKPFFLAYPIIVAVTYWLMTKNWRRTMISFAVIAVLAAAVIAPWTYRNYQKFGAFIPISYNGGFVLYINNNNMNADGGWMPAEKVDTYKEAMAGINWDWKHGESKGRYDYRRSEAVKAEAKRWIMDNPLTFIKLGILRTKETFFAGAWDLRPWAMNELEERKKAEWQAMGIPWNNTEFERDMATFLGLSSFLIYALSVAGFLYILVCVKPILAGLFRRQELVPGLVVVPVINSAFFIAVYFVFEGQARYCFPILFVFMICLAVTIDSLRRNLVIEKA
jgi:hypothetical protein